MGGAAGAAGAAGTGGAAGAGGLPAQARLDPSGATRIEYKIEY